MMDSYLPITEAAKKVNLSTKDLNQLALLGKIKSVMMKGQILLRESDVMALQPEENYSDLSGKPISIGEASRRYQINQQTISRWKDKGYIKVIGKEKNRILLNEADIARMADWYHSRPGKGRRTDLDLQK